jgi:multisubunit Na+/H+ antiporter MnhG subunit
VMPPALGSLILVGGHLMLLAALGLLRFSN